MKAIGKSWRVVFCVFTGSGGLGCAPEPMGESQPLQVSEVTEALTVTATAGAEFRHTMASSRFKLGDVVKETREGELDKTIGAEGVFSVNAKNGAALATPNASASLGKGKPLDNPKAFKALSSDENVHNERVLSYFQGLGLPANEVGGVHVTTTMEGRASSLERLTPDKTQFVSYATHIERVISGVPVVSSQAWATFDIDDNVEAEGVFWPPIPTEVVAKALALKRLFDSPPDNAALRAKINEVATNLREGTGRVVIAHTNSAHAEAAVSVAAYEFYTRGPRAEVRRFDENGSRLQLADEIVRPREADSLKPSLP